MTASLTRREFLAIAAGAPTALAAGCVGISTDPPGLNVASATLHATPTSPTETIAPGLHDLAPDGAAASLYVPAGYTPAVAAPLVVLLHGAGRDRGEWLQSPLLPLFDEQGIVVLSPDSTGPTWDRIIGGFGPDVRLIDAALKATFRRCNIDGSRLTLGGFSDGASYALSLGMPNGKLFSALMAFSPGLVASPGNRGLPRVFVAHGTEDPVLPFDQTSQVIVPSLRAQGYSVKFEQFSGVHAIYLSVVTDALQWLLHPEPV